MTFKSAGFGDSFNNNRWVVIIGFIILLLGFIFNIPTGYEDWRNMLSDSDKLTSSEETPKISPPEHQETKKILLKGTVLDATSENGIYRVKVIPRSKPGSRNAYTDQAGVFSLELSGQGTETIKFVFEHKDYGSFVINQDVNFESIKGALILGEEIYLNKKKTSLLLKKGSR